MPSLYSVLQNVGDRQINKLVDSSVIRLASITSEGSFSTSERLEMILKLRGEVGLLRDKESRAVYLAGLVAAQRRARTIIIQTPKRLKGSLGLVEKSMTPVGDL